MLQILSETLLISPYLVFAAIGAGAMVVQLVYKAWENS